MAGGIFSTLLSASNPFLPSQKQKRKVNEHHF
jgi:hypothetical protein